MAQAGSQQSDASGQDDEDSVMAESDYMPQPEFPEDSEFMDSVEQVRQQLRKFFAYRMALQRTDPDQEDKAQKEYNDRLRKIANTHQEEWEYIQNQNTLANIEMKNKQHLLPRMFGIDDAINETIEQAGTVPYGFENTRNLNPYAAYGVTLNVPDKNSKGVSRFYTAGQTDIDTPRHEAIHTMTKGFEIFEELGVHPEELPYLLEYVRGLHETDTKRADRAKANLRDYGSVVNGKAVFPYQELRGDSFMEFALDRLYNILPLAVRTGFIELTGADKRAIADVSSETLDVSPLDKYKPFNSDFEEGMIIAPVSDVIDEDGFERTLQPDPELFKPTIE